MRLSVTLGNMDYSMLLEICKVLVVVLGFAMAGLYAALKFIEALKKRR